MNRYQYLKSNFPGIELSLKKTNGTLFILFIPGGSVSLGASRFKEWQKQLYKKNISSLCFNFPGVEKSKGKIEENSLIKRIELVNSILNFIIKELKPIQLFVFGTSMGGYIALMTKIPLLYNISGLILDAPAAYSMKAEKMHFNNQFTSVLKQKLSWKSSRSFKALKNLNVPVLFFEHQIDKIIPKQITKEYLSRLKKGDSYILLNDAPHNIWDINSKKYKDEMFINILKFIKYNKK